MATDLTNPFPVRPVRGARVTGGPRSPLGLSSAMVRVAKGAFAIGVPLWLARRRGALEMRLGYSLVDQHTNGESAVYSWFLRGFLVKMVVENDIVSSRQ